MPQPLHLANRAGLAQPGFQGTDHTDPYLNVPIDADALDKWYMTRRAILADRSFELGVTKNDLLAAWRATFTPGSVGARSRALVALDGTSKIGPLASGANAAQEGAYKGSAMVIDAGNAESRGGTISARAVPARFRFPTAAGFETNAVLGLFLTDEADTGAQLKVFNRAADASNRIELLYVNTATPALQLYRVVATVATAESGAATMSPNVTGQRRYVAIGFRTSADQYSVFANGKRVLSGTLSGAALALTGNGVGFGLDGANMRAGLVAFESFALTA